MGDTQLELEKNRVKQRNRVAQVLPDVMKGVSSLTAEVYKDGVLSCKVKRLMALALALGTGCQNCILSQTMEALENGATKEEIFEAIHLQSNWAGGIGCVIGMEAWRREFAAHLPTVLQQTL